jgi:hypothetical protein
MPKARDRAKARRKVSPIVTVIQPVAKRLERMEDLLIEMRYEQDVQLKKIAALARLLDALTEQVGANSASIRPRRK